jgi:hypothetical protein
MKEYICKYCGSSLELFQIFHYEYIFHCNFHKYKVIFWVSAVSNNLVHVRFIAKENLVDIDYYSNKIVLNCKLFPMDTNLTPENIENKIKTYLTFQ